MTEGKRPKNANISPRICAKTRINLGSPSTPVDRAAIGLYDREVRANSTVLYWSTRIYNINCSNGHRLNIAIIFHLDFYCGNLEVFRGQRSIPMARRRPDIHAPFFGYGRLLEKMASENDASAPIDLILAQNYFARTSQNRFFPGWGPSLSDRSPSKAYSVKFSAKFDEASSLPSTCPNLQHNCLFNALFR